MNGTRNLWSISGILPSSLLKCDHDVKFDDRQYFSTISYCFYDLFETVDSLIDRVTNLDVLKELWQRLVHSSREVYLDDDDNPPLLTAECTPNADAPARPPHPRRGRPRCHAPRIPRVVQPPPPLPLPPLPRNREEFRQVLDNERLRSTLDLISFDDEDVELDINGGWNDHDPNEIPLSDLSSITHRSQEREGVRAEPEGIRTAEGTTLSRDTTTSSSRTAPYQREDTLTKSNAESRNVPPVTTRSGRVPRSNRRHYNDSMTNGLVVNKSKYASANTKLQILNSCFLNSLDWSLDEPKLVNSTLYPTWDLLLHDVQHDTHFDKNSIECIHPCFLTTKANKDDNPT